jgi:pimeloyl-ACP methyl ester carboxylesterase
MTTTDLTSAPVQAVEVDGVRLAYRSFGSGPPVVLIMGLGADGLAWREHVTAWSRTRTCIAVDNRGTGESDRPRGPYSSARMADDYAGVIRHLALDRPSVVGISMGGTIAQELALRHPGLVGNLVLVSSWAACTRYTQEVFRSFALVRAASREAFARTIPLWIWTDRWTGSHQERLLADRAAAVASPMPDHAFAAQVEACATHDARDRLSEIAARTLVTAGTADIFTPVAYAEELVAGIRHAQLRVFQGLGHAHHWEALDAFNDVVEEWL